MPYHTKNNPSGRFLYATNEHEGDDPPGVDNAVSAFGIDRSTGSLTFLNKVSSRGEGPNHISVDRTGRTLLVANFRNGTVAALPIQQDGTLQNSHTVIVYSVENATGRLTPIQTITNVPEPACIAFVPGR